MMVYLLLQMLQFKKNIKEVNQTTLAYGQGGYQVFPG